MAPGQVISIRLDGNQLASQHTGQGKIPIFAETEGKFFPKVVEAQIEFVKGPNGKVSTLVLHQNGQKISMARLSDAEAEKTLRRQRERWAQNSPSRSASVPSNFRLTLRCRR
jgi:hypothetical protein